MRFDLPVIEDEEGRIDGQWFDVISPRRLSEERRQRIEEASFALMAIPGISERLAAGGIKELTSMGDNPAIIAAALGAEPAVIVRAMKSSSHALILAHVREWSFGEVSEAVLLRDVPGEYLDLMTKRIEEVRKSLAAPSLTDIDPANPDSPTSPSVASASS